MLDMDVVCCQGEVWLVLPLFGRRRLVSVVLLIFVGNVVQKQEVGDSALLVAFEPLALQRAQIVLLHVARILTMGLEIGLAFVQGEMVLKPGHHEFVEFRGFEKPLDDGLDHLAHGPVVLGHLGQ